MKRIIKITLVIGAIICAAALVVIALIPNSGGYVRANCFGSLSDQLIQARSVFDVTITDSEYVADTDSCSYTLALNEVIKSEHTITLKEIYVSERLDYKSCIDVKERSIHNCTLPDRDYLLFTAGGSDRALKDEVDLHPRYNYFQPIDRKNKVKDFLKEEK